VLVRLTSVEDRKLSEAIRRATNWQNAISERDLRSGDFIQKRLQVEFERLGYYYERKRNEWTLLCKARSTPAMESTYPKRNLDNQRLAQLYLAFWSEKPRSAKMEKAEIFKTKGYYNEVFKTDTTAENLLLPKLVYDRLKRSLGIGYKKWGARRTTKYLVKIYGDFTMLSVMGKVLKTRYDLNRRRVALLVARLENPDDHRDFISSFEGVARKVIDASEYFAKRELHEAKRRGESLDVRTLFVREKTLERMFGNRRVAKAIRESSKLLPRL